MAWSLASRIPSLSWFGIILLGVLVSIVEAIGAALIFGLVASVASGTSVSEALPSVLTSVGPWLLNRSDAELAFVIVAFFALRAVFTLVQVFLSHRAVFDTAATASIDLMGFYLDQDYSYHVERGSAELIRNSRDAIDVIAHHVLVPLLRAGSETLVSFGLLMALFLVAPATTAAIVGVLSIVGLIIFLLMRAVLVPLGHESHDASRASLKASQELLRGIRDIKFLESDKEIRRPFETAQRRWERANYWRSTVHAAPRLVAETTIAILVLGLLALSGNETAEAQPIALVGLFAYAAVRLIPASALVLAALNGLGFGAAALLSVSEDLTSAKSRDKFRVDATAIEQSAEFERLVTFEGVDFSYPRSSQISLGEVSFSIEHGTSTGIIGPSGSGKSTVVDLLVGLLHPTGGSIKVDGVALDARPGWTQRIGLVSQASYIANESILRNIAYGVPDDAINYDEAFRLAELTRIVDFAAADRGGLEMQVGEMGVELSGGERQRIALARALYRSPEILVLDEATSALDPATEEAVLTGTIREMQGRTIVVVSHNERTVEHCNQLVLLIAGTVAVHGSRQDVVESPEYRWLMKTHGSGWL